MKAAACLLVPCTLLAALAPHIEERGSANWPGANHFRFHHTSTASKGLPIWVDAELDRRFNPDSIRVIPDGAGAPIPAKTEWRVPNARISWISTGAAAYTIYFDLGSAGETHRLAAPAMVGDGDRVTFGRTGVQSRLAVGLWAHPAPLDFDGDGNIDLIVGCADRPYNGTYLFRTSVPTQSLCSTGPSGSGPERRTSSPISMATAQRILLSAAATTAIYAETVCRSSSR